MHSCYVTKSSFHLTQVLRVLFTLRVLFRRWRFAKSLIRAVSRFNEFSSGRNFFYNLRKCFVCEGNRGHELHARITYWIYVSKRCEKGIDDTPLLEVQALHL